MEKVWSADESAHSQVLYCPAQMLLRQGNAPALHSRWLRRRADRESRLYYGKPEDDQPGLYVNHPGIFLPPRLPTPTRPTAKGRPVGAAATEVEREGSVREPGNKSRCKRLAAFSLLNRAPPCRCPVNTEGRWGPRVLRMPTRLWASAVTAERCPGSYCYKAQSERIISHILQTFCSMVQCTVGFKTRTNTWDPAKPTSLPRASSSAPARPRTDLQVLSQRRVQ